MSAIGVAIIELLRELLAAAGTTLGSGTVPPPATSSSLFSSWPPNPPVIGQELMIPDPGLSAKLSPVRDRHQRLIDRLNVGRSPENRVPDLCVGVMSIDDTAAQTARFFSWNSDKMCSVGSTSKLMILYAAFQLRDDVRKVASQPGVNRGNLREKLLEAWANSGVRALADCAAELAGADKAPFLEEIFDLSDLSRINFTGNTDPLRPCGVPNLYYPLSTHPEQQALVDDLDTRHQGEYYSPRLARWLMILELDFGPRLWLTSRWSDNAAAHTCAAEIGLPYIYALMKASGLYNDTGRGLGMRLLMASYEPGGVPSPPASWSARAKTLAQRCSGAAVYGTVLNRLEPTPPPPPAARYSTVIKQAATIRTLSALMLALAREKLIDPDASREMVSFLRLLSHMTVRSGLFSYVELALGSSRLAERGLDLHLPQRQRYVDLWSKIGVVTPMYCDFAFLRFKQVGATKTDSLGIVILNYEGSKDPREDPSAEHPNSRLYQCIQDIVEAYEKP